MLYPTAHCPLATAATQTEIEENLPQAEVDVLKREGKDLLIEDGKGNIFNFVNKLLRYRQLALVKERKRAII